LSGIRHHLTMAASIGRAIIRELRRGGPRNLPKNLAEAAESDMVDLQAKMTGTPLVAFDAKSGKVKARA